MTVEARIADSSRGEHDACCLELPHVQFQDSFVEGAAEFAGEGHLDSTYAAFLGFDVDRLRDNFSGFVADLLRMADESRVFLTGYRDCIFWLSDEGLYVGQTSIRPELGTPYLITYGGHIGYSIRPSHRRQGYGRRILQLALEKCAEMGLERALVTCDEDNTASRRIIESNGGVFESGLVMDETVARAEGRAGEKVRKLRYWLELPPA
ncbi:MAG: GNAT family N-acetyltransferase [bacterium]|nr:GNAT family N-acetyltransferase [bacterium]